MLRASFAVALAALFVPTAFCADMLSGSALVHALQKGGYVIVMRHASSPRDVPDKEHAAAGNTKPERQLDAEGIATATAMGKALRELKIPVGEVWSSPTFRALQTVRYAQLGTPKPVEELGDNGRSMQGGTPAQAAWLKKQVTEFPKGSNTVLITHFPNVRDAFPSLAAGMSDGEAFVFGPDGEGGATLVARVKIDEWPQLKD